MIKITGLRIEKYIGESVSGHNCDFIYEDAEKERHVLCGIKSDGTKVEIKLWEEEGECGSGWTTASWGHIEVKEVDKFNGYTHRPIGKIEIENFSEYSNQIENKVFSVDSYGWDEYYPSGNYSVNMDLFIETPRYKEKRPVWLFVGKSALGKSFLASKLTDMSVYETDSSNELPTKITEDIVVLGNKYTYELEDIKKNIFGEHELIVVDFK